MPRPGESFLCVVQFPSNTGFAWNYIETLYAGVADIFAAENIRTFVAYPSIEKFPKPLTGSAAIPLVLDASLETWGSVRETVQAIQRLKIRTIYFTDIGAWHWAFPLLRAAGVRRIVSHDHTSGERTVPTGVKRAGKWVQVRLPGMTADLVIGVSEYVARRQREVAMMPHDRVVRLWNGVDVPDLSGPVEAPPIAQMTPGRHVILCVCRAARDKGVDYLLRAFDLVIARWPANEPPPLLVYVGSGPEFAALDALRESLACREHVVFTGYRPDVANFIAHATISVVPSVWQEASGLGVLEPMSHAKPVIASSVGGIPESIDSAEVGELVPPANIEELAEAITRLVRDPARRDAVGRAARARIVEHFDRKQQIASLVELVRG